VSQSEKAETKPSVQFLVAQWISAIVHPVAFPLFTLGVVTYAATRSLAEAIRWVMVALLLTTVPISVLVSVQVLRRRWTDLDVSVRRQRYMLYPFGIACMAALALVFAHFGAPELAVRAAVAVAVANTVDGLINFTYKVSAHATGAAVCAAVLWVGAPAWGLPATAAALAVGWSRVALRRHTPGQVVLGWVVGVLSTLLALYLPLRLGAQG
jgi:membrane-associated phospholipid phosphatase